VSPFLGSSRLEFSGLEVLETPHLRRRQPAVLLATEGARSADLAQQFDVHSNQITWWKAQLPDGAADVFGSEKTASANLPVDVKTLRAKIGELTLAKDFREARSARPDC
jgi:transposase-like protein